MYPSVSCFISCRALFYKHKAVYTTTLRILKKHLAILVVRNLELSSVVTLFINKVIVKAAWMLFNAPFMVSVWYNNLFIAFEYVLVCKSEHNTGSTCAAEAFLTLSLVVLCFPSQPTQCIFYVGKYYDAENITQSLRVCRACFLWVHVSVFIIKMIVSVLLHSLCPGIRAIMLNNCDELVNYSN